MAYQVGEEIEDLGLQLQQGVATLQFATIRIERIVFKEIAQGRGSPASAPASRL